jgi:hypothetical protein
MPRPWSSPHDPHAPPAGVLPRHTHDQRPGLRVDGRASLSTPTLVGPLSPNELSVPPHERGRGHDERRPALPRRHPAHRREEQLSLRSSLGRLICRRSTASSWRRTSTSASASQPENAPGDCIEERVVHGGGWYGIASRRANLVSARSPSARSLGQASDPSARSGEPQVGLPQDPGGAPEARHRRLGHDHRHGAPRRRTRPCAASDRPHLDPVPEAPGVRRALPRTCLRPGGRPPRSRGRPAGADVRSGDRGSNRPRPPRTDR